MNNEHPINGGGYRVPEGYFDQMRAQVLVSVEAIGGRPVALGPAWRSAVAFAASFAGLVVLALGGYYLTGYRANKAELAAAEEEQVMWLYQVEEAELYDSFELNSSMLAQAAIEYLEDFGDLPLDEYE